MPKIQAFFRDHVSSAQLPLDSLILPQWLDARCQISPSTAAPKEFTSLDFMGILIQKPPQQQHRDKDDTTVVVHFHSQSPSPMYPVESRPGHEALHKVY